MLALEVKPEVVSILASQKLTAKACKQVFKRPQDRITSSAGTWELWVTAVCVCTCPHLSPRWLPVLSCHNVRKTTRPTSMRIHLSLHCSFEILLVCMNFLKYCLADHTSTMEPSAFGRCAPWARGSNIPLPTCMRKYMKNT